ncbi:dihydropyrimidinase [Oceanispirochaeta sp.]|jgi:dihydropyrimidinase|uniref:dihydropyrimidinase n=1 Tax=Oceanispirochaeta sp. TaxID=2035350 RepID=UPI00260358F5|nr:dihydropyrimidinase [Oceanispirochaeta sp.]MDA3957874.1 dihydropyrimidinase [Oceanispirochaeta sp.]
MFDLVISQGTIVTSTSVSKGDLGIKDGKIAALGQDLEGKRVIDARGKLVTPGAVDTHVHLEMPIGQYVSTDDFYTGTRAAAFGGTTSIIDFVESKSSQTFKDALEDRKALAETRSVIDFGLHMTIGPDDLGKLDQIPGIMESGCGSFKLYMAYGLRLKDDQLYKALSAVGKAGGLPVVHAENWDIISALIEENLAQGNTSPHWHPRSRPEEFEAEAAARVIQIARQAGSRVHIFHVSCPQVVEEISKARVKGVAVTAETCPQYLLLTRDLYDREGVEGALAVCSPPLRSDNSRRELWQALGSGLFDTVSTDHCPFCREEKGADLSAFNKIPGGVPSMEIRFSALYSEGVGKELISLSEWVDLCCTTPAALFGLKEKGEIAIGKDADIVVFDPDVEWTVTPGELQETAGWTPYDGMILKGRPSVTISRGNILVEEGEFKAEKGRGQFLKTRTGT